MKSKNLTKEELVLLDKEIDSEIPSEQLRNLSLNVAIIEILRFFEDYYRLYSKMHYAALRNGIDGMNYLMKWVYKYCKDDQNMDFKSRQGLYLSLSKFHENAMDYSYVWDCMSETYRGKLVASREDKKIFFEEADKFLRDLEIADIIISHTEDRQSYSDIKNSLSFDPQSIYNRLGIWKSGENKIKYTLSDELYKEVEANILTIKTLSWELDENWDLGGYKVKDFRKFWVAIATLCIINMFACLYSGLEGGAVESVVMFRKKEKWINELRNRTGLSNEIIISIFNDLIYNSALYSARGKKLPDIIYQPFFHLGNDIYALSGALVLIASAERNIWNLVGIIREDVHSKLKNLKEDVWRNELVKKLKKKGYFTSQSINYNFQNEKGEIDLLIIDKKKKEIGCIELKWLAQPDRISEVIAASEQIDKGTKQAKKGKAWIEHSLREVSKIINISENELKSYKVFPIVLSKNTLGVNHYSETTTAVVNEYLFNSILYDPLNLSIERLWTIITKHVYIPREGKDFISKDVSGKFGNLEFTAKGSGMEIVENAWSISDIAIT